MTNSTAMGEKVVHEGRNVKRIREILGIKQEALAMDLGLSQQAISQTKTWLYNMDYWTSPNKLESD
jgi:DNA-binding XRE family transcriptional regulator